MKKLLVFGLFILGLLAPSLVRAEEGCSASIAPSFVTMGSASTSVVTVSNNGSQMINWVRIQSPGLAAYTIAHLEAAGWYPNGGGTEGNFAGGYLEGGTSSSFDVMLAETGEVVETMSWEVLASYDAGENFVSCGTVSLRVEAAPVPPTISGISISISSSTASTIEWSTNVVSSTLVQYGTSESYGGSVSGDAGTTHRVVIYGLLPETTYHYRLVSEEVGGLTAVTNDLTFTTGTVDTVTSTVTVTNIVTNTLTNTNTVTKVVTDTTPPVLKSDTLGKKVYETAPLVTGSVSDDRGVAKVEYRIKDKETAWSSGSLQESVGSKRSAFEFLPPLSLDGTYEIELRGEDIFGNVSTVKRVSFVIDKLPPTVGGGVVSYGALPLRAEGGVVSVLAGREYEVVLYEEGGADEVTIEIANHKFSNSQIGSQGLWRSLIKFEEAGEFTSIVRAADGAGNVTERKWVVFRVIASPQQSGQLYYLDPTTKRFGLWEAEEYGQKQGEVGWYVPRGEYYVQDENVVSQRIVLEQDGWIAGSFEENEPRWWERVFQIRRKSNLTVTQWHGDTIKPGLQVGREKWIGKRAIVYIAKAELPWYSETKRRAEEWARIEGAIMVELPAVITTPYGLLPQVYLVNDRGDVIDYKEGVWTR